MNRDLELSVPPPDFQGGDWRLVQRAPGLVNAWRFGEDGVSGEGMGAPYPLPMPGPMHLFRLGVPELFLFK